MKKEDFCFSIGFTGETAIVDKKNRARYGKLSSKELADKGLFKPALCSALYDEDQDSLDYILTHFNEKSGAELSTSDELKKVFGVYGIPEGIKGIKAL